MSTAICALTDNFEKACGFDSYKHVPFDGFVGYYFRCAFTLMDYFPLIITLGKMVVGALIGSVALYIGGIGLFVDLILNFVLQQIIQQEGPYPCVVYDEYQMPALASQTVAFFVTGFVLFVIIYKRSVGLYLLGSIYALGYAALYKRVFDAINTPEQLVAGALVGFADALVQHALLFWVFRKYIPWFCATEFAQRLHAENHCFHNNRSLDIANRAWVAELGRASEAERVSALRAADATIGYKLSAIRLVTPSGRATTLR